MTESPNSEPKSPPPNSDLLPFSHEVRVFGLAGGLIGSFAGPIGAIVGLTAGASSGELYRRNEDSIENALLKVEDKVKGSLRFRK